MRLTRREENHVTAVYRKLADARRLPEDALAPVPEDGVSKPLGCDEGDPTRLVPAARENTNSQERVVVPLPTREDLLKITPGLDGLHQHMSRR